MKHTDRFATLRVSQEGDLSHAQATLQVAKDVVDNNAPINEAEGNHEQAQLERDTSASIAEAQEILATQQNGQAQVDGTAGAAPELGSQEPAAAVSTEEADTAHEGGDNAPESPVAVSDPVVVEAAPEQPEATKQTKVFLGGTINGSDWREALIPQLEIDYYNPVVEIWTMESQQMEEDAKINSDFNLFVITPKQSGFFSIAELTASAIRNPEKTLLAVLKEDNGDTFDAAQLKSMDAVADLIKSTGATVFDNLGAVSEFLNSKKVTVSQERCVPGLSSAAEDVLLQLGEKVDGVEDGDLISKEGRDQLVELGHARRDDQGMNFITETGTPLVDEVKKARNNSDHEYRD